MKLLAALALALPLVGCAAQAKPHTTPTPHKTVVETPSSDADIVKIPGWIDDDVQICVERPFLNDVQCMYVHELRQFLFLRRKS